MSLKAFHVVFISFSALLAFGFGFWMLLVKDAGINSTDIIAALFSFAFGISLIIYEYRFLRKFKHIKFM